LYKLYRSKMGNQPGNLHRPLMITLLIFAAFSIGYIYMPINSLPLPLFRLVHVPSRFFILPLLFLIALACICLQEWLDRDPAESWRYLVLFLLLGIFGHDLLRHTQLWRVEFVIESFSGGLYEVPLDFNLHIANQIDPLNTNTLIVSSVISLIAIVYIFNLLRKGFAKARSFG
jgi:hypothetical protein